MELEQYVSVFKRWWWLLVACVVLAAGTSYYGTTLMPRIYQATTTVMVGQTLEQVNPNSMDLYISQQLAQTYAEMVKRRPILQSAAQALGLEYVPSSGNISTRQVAGTQLLEISVRDTIPERARLLADEIANQLILQSPSASADQDRQDFVRDQLGDLQARIESTEAEIARERGNLEAANSARAIQQYQANINALEQKLSSYQATYASLSTSVRGGTNYISIVEPATTPGAPISPNVQQTVLLAAAIGLTLAVAGAFLIEYLDDTIKTPEDAARIVDLPTLGAISRIAGEGRQLKLIAAREPLSPIVESYRALRTNIQFSSVDQPARALMVTSPNPSEGKTVTLANLAVVMAQSGLQVIAVDSDLRRPVLRKMFGLSQVQGLSDAILSTRSESAVTDRARGARTKDPAELLVSSNPSFNHAPASDSGVRAYLQTTEVDNLLLLPSGPLPPNPAELLGSQRMKYLVQELKEQADVVLFDSPPVLAVTDAAVLSTQVDGVLVVFDVGQTRRETAERGVEELRRVGANLLGVVLNRLSRVSGGYYYYHYEYGPEGHSRKKRRRSQKRRWLGQRSPSAEVPSDGAGEKDETTGKPSGAIALWLRRGNGNADGGDQASGH